MKKFISFVLAITMLCTVMLVGVSAKTVEIYQPVLSENYNLQTPASYFTINNFQDGKGVYDVLDYDATGVVRKIIFKDKAETNQSGNKVYAAWNGFSEKMTGSVNKFSFDYKLEGSNGAMIGFGTNNPWYCYSSSPWFIFIRTDSVYIAPNATGDDVAALMNSTGHITYTVDNTQWQRMTIEIDKTAQTGKVYIGETLVKTMETTGTAVFLNSFDAIAFESPNAVTMADKNNAPVLCLNNLKIEASEDGVNYTTTLTEDYSLNTAPASYETYGRTSGLPYYQHNDGSKAVEGFVANEGNDFARKITFNTKEEGKNVWAGLSGLQELKTNHSISKMSIKFALKVIGNTPVAMYPLRAAGYDGSGALFGVFGADKAFGVFANAEAGGELGAYSGFTYELALTNSNIKDYVKQFTPGSWYDVEYVLDFGNNTIDLFMQGEQIAKQQDLKANTTWMDNFALTNYLMFNVGGAITTADSSAVVMDNMVVSKITTIENQVKLADASGTEITTITDGDTVYLNATVANDGDTSQDYVAFAAAYNQAGDLIDCGSYKINNVSSNGIQTLDGTSCSFKIPSDTVTIKAFLWTDSMQSMCGAWTL